ncbi:MAG: serine protease [Deltaproteobacteria bacterium]|nr:MAG: serine protease [Deltaproteobacteria bacterium]
MIGSLAVLLVAVGVAPAVAKSTTPVRPAAKAPRPAPAPAPVPTLCEGDYADSVPAARASEILDAVKDQFVFSIRNIATYERVYYGRDGKLRRNYIRSVVHGTGFAYQVKDGETLIVTNEHVANRPDVTDDEHQVDGVPPGSKKVREQIKIVRDEEDDYEPGHVPLKLALSDSAADIAIVKARKILPVMPFRVGRSSALRPGNLVQVRGFPLGAFAAVNVGKVVNPYTEDTEHGWSHSDFVVDALLSAGNSGSPVFAVNCRTSQPELVGVFHAGYSDAAALNVVVSVDQLREELETLHVPKREGGLRAEITAQDRDRLVKELFAEQTHALTFPFGGRIATVRLADPTTLRFSILDDDYPLVVREGVTLVDRGANGFGTLDGIVVPVDGAPAEASPSLLDAEVRDHFDKLYDSLWHQVLGVVDYRSRLARAQKRADAFDESQQAKMRLRKRNGEQKELLGLCLFDADRAGAVAQRAVATPPVAVAAPTQPSADDTVAAARKDPPVQPSSIAPVAPSQTGSGGDRSGR